MQPVPLQPLLPRRPTSFPVTRSYARGDEFIRDEDRVRIIAERPPSLKPLDFGDGSLLGRNRPPRQTRRKESSGQSKRPSIGNPTEFRRLDLSEGKRHSLVPLKLSPVVLIPQPYANDTPLADAHETSAEEPAITKDCTSYREHRTSPYQRVLGLSSTALAGSSPLAVPERVQTMPSIRESQPPRRPLSTRSSSSSLHSDRRDTHSSTTPTRPVSEYTHSPASSVQSIRRNVDASAAMTPNRSLPWSKRKRSASSFRKTSAESLDWELDKEILELNTIVEERRAEASRSHQSNDIHIPAVAPSMAGKARSETLNDIGSVFSRPVFAGSLPVAMTKRLSRPFTSVPEHYTVPATSPATSTHRLSGWLSDLAPSPSSDTPREAFKNHAALSRGRHVSQSSLLTSADDSDVPSLTAASTPTSFARGHNRSSTADSRILPASPPATIYEHRKLEKHTEEAWRQQQPVILDDYEVGMAL